MIIYKHSRPKLAQTRPTWYLVCDQRSSVGLCMQDYKPLCVAVMICPTLVNTQTHRQTANYTINSASQLT